MLDTLYIWAVSCSHIHLTLGQPIGVLTSSGVAFWALARGAIIPVLGSSV